MPPIGPSLYLKRVKQPTSLASPASGLPPLAPLSDSKKESMKPLLRLPKKSPSLRDGNLNLALAMHPSLNLLKSGQTDKEKKNPLLYNKYTNNSSRLLVSPKSSSGKIKRDYLSASKCVLVGMPNKLIPIKKHFPVSTQDNLYSFIQINTRAFATIMPINSASMLHPYYITGFADGEGCFLITLLKNSKLKTGWVVQLVFQINLHEKDLALLKLIQSSLDGVGSITKHGENSVQYRVNSIKDIAVIINHFDKYPLITQKRADYELFKMAFEILLLKEHLTPEGLIKLVAIKAVLNRGLTEPIINHFSPITPISRPLVETTEIADGNWLAGFTEAEGNFDMLVRQSKNKIGFAVTFRFRITQHTRDIELMKKLIPYFGCGQYEVATGQEVVNFVEHKFSDISEKIIPFFNKYSLQGVKALDFSDFCKVAELMSTQEHLTKEGLTRIQNIKVGMNRGRQMSTLARPQLNLIKEDFNFIPRRDLHLASRLVKNNYPKNNKVNLNNKLIPIVKHFPVSSQEWDNSIYAYNKKNTILLPSIDKMVIKLIKSYFNSYLAAVRGLNHSPELELSVYSKTYVSKPEIKHTNSKVIITIYRYMVNKNYGLPEVKIDYEDIIPCRISEIKSIAYEKKWSKLKLKKIIKKITKKLKKMIRHLIFWGLFKHKFINNPLLDNRQAALALDKPKNKLSVPKSLGLALKKLRSYTTNGTEIPKQFKLHLNQFISEYYPSNKDVIIRVIKLKYLHLNTSILVEYLANKLTNKIKVLRQYRQILKRIELPLYFKHNYSSSSSLSTKKDGNNRWLNELSINNISNISIEKLKEVGKGKKNKKFIINKILSLIKYKALIGLRLEIGGRLTKRNVASMSVFKVGQKGTLKNIDSSYKGIPVVSLRGNQRPNLSYSSFNSKTTSGSFNVKGWGSYYYSTSAVSEKSTLDVDKINLNPQYVTGITDGEGSFIVKILKNKKLNVGWEVQLSFQITLHQKDRPLLELIKASFGGVGHIHKDGKNCNFQYRVSSIKDLPVILAHFGKYPLATQKQADYELFKQVAELVLRKEHLTSEGLEKIVTIRASINDGLSNLHINSFPNIVPVQRPKVVSQGTIDPNWLAGFIEAEGCFYINILNCLASKCGASVVLKLLIAQHTRDKELLERIVSYLDCGYYVASKQGNYGWYTVAKFSDISNKILPFLEKYSLYGNKKLDCVDFFKVAELVKSKAHLTVEGLSQIREIKAGMNTGRLWENI